MVHNHPHAEALLLSSPSPKDGAVTDVDQESSVFTLNQTASRKTYSVACPASCSKTCNTAWTLWPKTCVLPVLVSKSQSGKPRGLQPGEQDTPGSSRATQRTHPHPPVVSKADALFRKQPWASFHHGRVMARISLTLISGEMTLILPEAPGTQIFTSGFRIKIVQFYLFTGYMTNYRYISLDITH